MRLVFPLSPVRAHDGPVQGVYVLGGMCPGVSVQGVSVQGVYVLGVSVRGVHVRGVLSCHHMIHYFTTI